MLTGCGCRTECDLCRIDHRSHSSDGMYHRINFGSVSLLGLLKDLIEGSKDHGK
jgi:hypothetical protein